MATPSRTLEERLDAVIIQLEALTAMVKGGRSPSPAPRTVARSRGHAGPPQTGERPTGAAKVIDLMEALKRSLARRKAEPA